MVVPVLMTSCQVSEKPNSGPVTAHTITTAHRRHERGRRARRARRPAGEAREKRCVLAAELRVLIAIANSPHCLRPALTRRSARSSGFLHMPERFGLTASFTAGVRGSYRTVRQPEGAASERGGEHGRYDRRRASGSQCARCQAAAERRGRQLQSRDQGRGRFRRRQGEPRRLPRDAGEVARAVAQARRRSAWREVVRSDAEKAARQVVGRRRPGSRRHHPQRNRGVRPGSHLGDQALPQGFELARYGGHRRRRRLSRRAASASWRSGAPRCC